MKNNLSVSQEPQLRMFDSPKQIVSKKSNNKICVDVISLFSGCGGMDLGFHQEKFDIKYANDIDKKACLTYKRNIGNHIICEDITKLDYDTIPDSDLIVGGFPFQNFKQQMAA